MIHTVDNVIRFGCSAYSGIFPNRAAVLNHLFCVNGNGYEWKNGQLIDVCDRDKRRLPLDKLIQAKFDEARKRDAEMVKWEQDRKNERKALLAAGDPATVADEAKVEAMLNKMVDDAKAANAKKSPEQLKEEREKYEQVSKEITHSMKLYNRNKYRIPSDIKKRIIDTNYNNWYPMSPRYFKMWEFPEDIKLDWWLAIVETCYLILQQPNFVDDKMHTQGIADNNQKMAVLMLNRAMKHCYGRVEFAKQYPDKALFSMLSEYQRWPKAIGNKLIDPSPATVQRWAFMKD